MGGMGRGVASLFKDPSVLSHAIKPGTTARIMRFARPFAGLLGIFLLVVCLDALAGVIPPLLYRDLINNGILKGDAAVVIELALLAAVILLADAGLGLAQSYLAAAIGNRIVLSIRTALFDHIQRMPLAFFIRVQTGALVSRLDRDVAGAQSAFTDVLSSVVGNIISVALVLVAMSVLSWRITLVSLALAPVFVLPARSLGRRLQALARAAMSLSARMSSMMYERFNVAGAQLSKLYGRPEEETAGFRTRAALVADNDVQRAQVRQYFVASLTLLGSLATAAAYGWGGVLTIRHEIDLGTLVALVSYLGRLYGPITGLSNVQVTVMTALVSFERVFEVLDLMPMITEKPDAKPVPPGPARIEFSHVSFRYPTVDEVSLASLEAIAVVERQRPEPTVLRDLDFAIAPGTLTALVGPSGAGKTTITQLVPRLYDVRDGAVTINAMDVRDATLASLHARVGIVAQDTHLFNDTIRANLVFARPGASEADLETALKAAQIWPLIASLPDGLDTLVGERGYRFSGGEKQRLSIARLLLKAPDIVILDEATAHLDSESEAAIQTAFEIALAGRTSIVIAHRLSTILKADQILVIQEGRIVERGTHTDLLARNGLYADLYRRQFRDAPE
ncbi:MAG TPA: ABC transporter ATP-binding protein [Rhizomicrobium sp.]|nr:ABC transporter ATP-binding protein [Rhizomicrobium sp.]